MVSQIHVLVHDLLIKIGGWAAFERNEIRIKKQPLPPDQCPASTTEPMPILLFQNCHCKVVASTFNPGFWHMLIKGGLKKFVEE